jgi:hypothetical protein
MLGRVHDTESPRLPTVSGVRTGSLKIVLSCPPVFLSCKKERVMPASLRKFSEDRKINPNNERPIQCPYCPQRYLLVWDDDE